MAAKDYTFYPLIILFFVLGLIIGYVIHKPETIVRIENRTIEVPVEKIVEVTPAATATFPAATPAPTDFTVKNVYDPSKDKPSNIIEFTGWQAVPDGLRVRSGETVLIKINDYTLASPMTLILNSTYTRNLGTSGAIVVTFNKKGQYSFKAIIPSGDPTILPRTYAQGTITVY